MIFISSRTCKCRTLFCFFQAEDGIRGRTVTGVQTCALPISWLRAGSLCMGLPQRGHWVPSGMTAMARLRSRWWGQPSPTAVEFPCLAMSDGRGHVVGEQLEDPVRHGERPAAAGGERLACARGQRPGLERAALGFPQVPQELLAGVDIPFRHDGPADDVHDVPWPVVERDGAELRGDDARVGVEDEAGTGPGRPACPHRGDRGDRDDGCLGQDDLAAARAGGPLGDGAADARPHLGFDDLGDGGEEVAELVVVAGPRADIAAGQVRLALGQGQDGRERADVEVVGGGGARRGGLPGGFVEAGLDGGVVVGDGPVGSGCGSGAGAGGDRGAVWQGDGQGDRARRAGLVPEGEGGVIDLPGVDHGRPPGVAVAVVPPLGVAWTVAPPAVAAVRAAPPGAAAAAAWPAGTAAARTAPGTVPVAVAAGAVTASPVMTDGCGAVPAAAGMPAIAVAETAGGGAVPAAAGIPGLAAMAGTAAGAVPVAAGMPAGMPAEMTGAGGVPVVAGMPGRTLIAATGPGAVPAAAGIPALTMVPVWTAGAGAVPAAAGMPARTLTLAAGCGAVPAAAGAPARALMAAVTCGAVPVADADACGRPAWMTGCGAVPAAVTAAALTVASAAAAAAGSCCR